MMAMVLIIEDNPLNMTLEADLLQMAGFNVLKAACAKEALEALQGTVPDLIILDIRLPDMDGFELFAKIRQDKKLAAVKVAAVTASAMKEDEEKIKALGFDAFIAKPIDIKNFARQISGLLA